MKNIKFRLATAATLAAALLAPATSQAGNTQVYGSYCTKAADGSGYCNGSAAALRINADANAYVYFGQSVGTYGVFGEYLNGQIYACSAPSYFAGLWTIAMTMRGEYFVSWNASGQCTGLTLYNTSNDTL